MKDLRKMRKTRYKKLKLFKLAKVNFTFNKRLSKKKHFRRLKLTVGLLKVTGSAFKIAYNIVKPGLMFTSVIHNKYVKWGVSPSKSLKSTHFSLPEGMSKGGDNTLPKVAFGYCLSKGAVANTGGTAEVILSNKVLRNKLASSPELKKVTYGSSYVFTNSLYNHLNAQIGENSCINVPNSYITANINLTKLLFLY